MDCVQVSNEVFAVLSEEFIVGEWTLWIDLGCGLIIVQTGMKKITKKKIISICCSISDPPFSRSYLYRYFA